MKGTIPFDHVYAAIKIIQEEVAYSLVNDIPVTVKNFGTLSPYVWPGHKAGYWAGKEGKGPQETKPTRRIKLHPHENFKRLIELKKEEFKNG